LKLKNDHCKDIDLCREESHLLSMLIYIGSLIPIFNLVFFRLAPLLLAVSLAFIYYEKIISTSLLIIQTIILVILIMSNIITRLIFYVIPISKTLYCTHIKYNICNGRILSVIREEIRYYLILNPKKAMPISIVYGSDLSNFNVEIKNAYYEIIPFDERGKISGKIYVRRIVKNNQINCLLDLDEKRMKRGILIIKMRTNLINAFDPSRSREGVDFIAKTSVINRLYVDLYFENIEVKEIRIYHIGVDKSKKEIKVCHVKDPGCSMISKDEQYTRCTFKLNESLQPGEGISIDWIWS